MDHRGVAGRVGAKGGRFRPGGYRERISGPQDKPFVTFRGEDARRTVLTWNGSAASGGGTSIKNSYGAGSQAVALYANAGRQLSEECYIEGHVDFIFGKGIALFGRCRYHRPRA